MQKEIYIQIPEDDASRPAQALVLGINRYKILPTPDYEPENAEWEFIPGDIVECEEREHHGKQYLQAIRKLGA